MKDQTPATIFDENTAAAYDQKTALWAPSRDALFSFMQMIFAPLPAQARILCVGVGTGTELIALAQNFPAWQFTGVEPAPAMLEVCRRKAQENGVAARCTWHEGFLDSLPACAPFDGATCLLVSQFLKEAQKRSEFFGQIAKRLRPGGILINSDLVLGLTPAVHENLFEVWLRMLGGSGWNEQDIEKMRASWRGHITALTPPEIEAIIEAGGFELPNLFFQTLFIHAWFSKRKSEV